VRFLVDMPVTPEAVDHLERGGHEAVHAASVGLATVSDPEILDVARREGRVVVTADLDYPRLLALEGAAGAGHHPVPWWLLLRPGNARPPRPRSGNGPGV